MRLIDADKLLMDIEHYNLSDGKFQHWVEIQPTVKTEPHWIPCSEYPEYDFEDVLIRWHDKRKGCEDDYILCEGYVVRKQWCCIFEDEDMSDYEPVEWVPISQRRNNNGYN